MWTLEAIVSFDLNKFTLNGSSSSETFRLFAVLRIHILFHRRQQQFSQLFHI